MDNEKYDYKNELSKYVKDPSKYRDASSKYTNKSVKFSNKCCNCLDDGCKYNQIYPDGCFSKDINIYTNWYSVPYAGERFLPIPITPNAGYFPLAFLRRNGKDKFINFLNEPVDIYIKNPYKCYDLKSEFKFLSDIQCDLSNDKIKLVKYWGNIDPTTVLLPIANTLIETYEVEATYASRILWILSGALNDAFVITWYLKYKWDIIRPCQYNSCFRTVICTPKHPSYPSGHSVAGGCAAEVLSYFFPAERESIYSVCLDCAYSRIYAGVHFKPDCDEGFKLGVNIGKSIIDYIKTQRACNGKKLYDVYSTYKNADLTPDYNTPIDGRESRCDSLLLVTD